MAIPESTAKAILIIEQCLIGSLTLFIIGILKFKFVKPYVLPKLDSKKYIPINKKAENRIWKSLSFVSKIKYTDRIVSAIHIGPI